MPWVSGLQCVSVYKRPNVTYPSNPLTPAHERFEFNEEETAFLLEGRPFEQFPEDLRQKVIALEMEEYLPALPRNLRALLANL